MAVDVGDPEIVRIVEKPADSCRIQGKDGRAGGVVKCEDGIQFVLAHVADGDGHSLLQRCCEAAYRWRPRIAEVSHGPAAVAMIRSGGGRSSEAGQGTCRIAVPVFAHARVSRGRNGSLHPAFRH